MAIFHYLPIGFIYLSCEVIWGPSHVPIKLIQKKSGWARIITWSCIFLKKWWRCHICDAFQAINTFKVHKTHNSQYMQWFNKWLQRGVESRCKTSKASCLFMPSTHLEPTNCVENVRGPLSGFCVFFGARDLGFNLYFPAFTGRRNMFFLYLVAKNLFSYTLPENRPSQKETSIPTIHFQVLLLLVSGKVSPPTNLQIHLGTLLLRLGGSQPSPRSSTFRFRFRCIPRCSISIFWKKS